MKHPNIVFIIDDQHRWDFMGYESGNGVTFTPNLDRLGRGGAIFRSAYCTSPLCSPSRAAIALGRYPSNSGCFTNLHRPPADSPSFVKQFQSAGYRTSVVGKTHMEIHGYHCDYTTATHAAYMRSLGWDEVREISGNGMLKAGIECFYSKFLKKEGVFDRVLEFYRRWAYFMDSEEVRRSKPHDWHHFEWPLEERYQESRWVADQALNWINNYRGEGPFLLHVGFAAPHSPIEPLPRFMAMYGKAVETPPWGVERMTEHDIVTRKAYRAMITQIDEYFGEIVEAVRKRGELDNTIFVFTSDHGEMAGDMGRDGKCMFFEASVRVPLLFCGPGVKTGLDSSAFVEGLDIGKTLCELAGVNPHLWDQGHSFAPLLRGEAHVGRSTAYSEMGCDRMIRDERYKLMWGDPVSDQRKIGRLHLDKPVNVPPSPARLYDLKDDPHELRDLIADPGSQDVLRRMQEKLLIRLNENRQTQPNQDRGAYRPV